MTDKDFYAWIMEMQITREEAAKLIGYSRFTVDKWIAGAIPIPERVRKLCKYTLADKRGLINWSGF